MGRDSAAVLRSIPSLTGAAPEFDMSALPPDPATLFFQWLAVAVSAGVAEPTAATLATVDGDGVPDSRTLILKDVDESGWAFAGAASSQKGQQLSVCPAAALNMWWQPLVRAVRVRGMVVEGSAGESAADFAARSESAQATVAAVDWRLWRVQPARVEFWQGRTDRRHLRIIYTWNDGWRLTVRGGDGPT